ncbi:hypothetical protein SLEP1_g15551 [Rubroshorea leprosula]|nr:hypothetical protein SLEP1_g15551 [Rubroshorea leprosula]
MRATFKEHRATNEKLKRIKLDLNLHTANERDDATSSQHHQRVASSCPLDDKSGSDSCKDDKAVSNEGSCSFVLPDLNMMPCEDDSGAETLYGTS